MEPTIGHHSILICQLCSNPRVDQPTSSLVVLFLLRLRTVQALCVNCSRLRLWMYCKKCCIITVWGIAGGAARSARTSDKDSAVSDVNAGAASAAAVIMTKSPDDGRTQRLEPAQWNGVDAELREVCFQGSEQHLVLHSFMHHGRIISNASAPAPHCITSLKDALTAFVVLQSASGEHHRRMH